MDNMNTLTLISMGVGAYRNRPKKKTKVEYVIKGNVYDLIIYNKRWMHIISKECNSQWELIEHIQKALRFMVPYPGLDAKMQKGVSADYEPSQDPEIRRNSV